MCYNISYKELQNHKKFKLKSCILFYDIYDFYTLLASHKDNYNCLNYNCWDFSMYNHSGEMIIFKFNQVTSKSTLYLLLLKHITFIDRCLKKSFAIDLYGYNNIKYYYIHTQHYNPNYYSIKNNDIIINNNYSVKDIKTELLQLKQIAFFKNH